MLAVVGMRGVGEEGQQFRDDDGEDFLAISVSIGVAIEIAVGVP